MGPYGSTKIQPDLKPMKRYATIVSVSLELLKVGPYPSQIRVDELDLLEAKVAFANSFALALLIRLTQAFADCFQPRPQAQM